MLYFFKKLLKLEFIYLLAFFLFGSMIYGMAINFILPKIGLIHPLSFSFIWPLYFLFFFPLISLVIGIINWIRLDLNSYFLKLIIFLNPILSIFGVNYLDNTGSGWLVILSQIIICLIFFYIFFKKDLNDITLKSSLYSLALSLVFANSLRSNYLVGWDIHQEFYVFHLTSMNNFWDINSFKDAYNACLSITILPTIIHNLTGLELLTIFRYIFPLISASVPVVVFQIGKKVTNSKYAFAGAFIFLLQFQFISQLPAILRQGIAFLFFALIIDIILKQLVNPRHQNLFIIIFGTGMILSHYSTTYVALTILLSAKLLIIIFCRFYNLEKRTSYISTSSIAILFLITFLWNILITNSAQGLNQTLINVINNIGATFSLENKSEVVKNIFFHQSDNVTAVLDYSTKSMKNISNPEYYKGFEIFPMSLNTGKLIQLNDPIPMYFHFLIPWLFRLSILIGVVLIAKSEFKNHQSPLVFSLSFSMFMIILNVIILPYLSINYNFERVFQQMLILLSPISIVGMARMFATINKGLSSISVVIILLSYLFQSTGLIDRVFYERGTWMFNNSGEQYYRYFTKSGEIKGINWLNKNTLSNILLYTDRYTKLRLGTYSDQKFSYISNQLNPPVIDKNAYVLSGFAATKKGVVFATINNKSLTFSFPQKYLSKTKNIIYSNPISYIYK